MSISDGDYIELLELINDAALDNGKWLPVLKRLASVTGCVAGGLTVEDPNAGLGHPITYFGFDPDHVEKTFDHYLPMNPLFGITTSLRAGAVLTNSMAVEIDAFTRSEFYSGWAKPQDLCCPVTVVLHRESSSFIPLTLVRPDGLGDVEEHDIRFLERLAPRLQKALAVSLMLQNVTAENNSFRQVIDHLGAAIFLINANGAVAHINSSGEDLVQSRSGVTVKFRRLSASGRSNRKLQDGIDAVLAGRQKGIVNVIIEREFERPLIAKIVPVSPQTAEGYETTRVGCAVILAPSSTGTKSQEDAVAAAYRLTNAETALLQALMAGHDVASAAAALKVSKSTALTHLRGIFTKTGVNKQKDLILLVTSSSAPLRHANRGRIG